MRIDVKPLTLKEFLDVARDRRIRRVLLTDYARVEPKREGADLVLVGMLRIVATAFDREPGVIYRWSEEDESARMVTVVAGPGGQPNVGGRLAGRKEQVSEVFREEGFDVGEGEWTPESAQAYLETRQKIVG